MREEINTNSSDINNETPRGEAGAMLRMTKGSLIRNLLLAFLLGAVVMLAVLSLLNGSGAIRNGQSAEQAEQYRKLEERFGQFSEMEDIIAENSIYDADFSSSEQGIADAILGTLGDDYAQYFTKEDYEAFERKYLREYSGIGVATTMDEEAGDRVVVSRVLEGGPAEEAGILPGDIIVAIDGNLITDLDAASEFAMGEPGSKVVVRILRDGVETEYTLYRKNIADKSVAHEVFDGEKGIGYIKIDVFRKGTAEEFENAIKSLGLDKCDKIIIDLRGNRGGVTEEAVKIADMLLPECGVMTIRNVKGEETEYTSDEASLDIRFVLLVDGETASAAEILAGAVKYNGAGKLIGSRTYGKGVIQSLYNLTNGSVLKITTEEYILPGGEKIHGVGIEPDIEAGEDTEIIDLAEDVLEEES